jgi:bifunctional non-homologous end joining protein LigD
MLEPMLASLADAPLEDPRLVYEPKYDGIRVIAEVGADGNVHLWSRLGNEKTAQFPEIVDTLRRWSRSRRLEAVLDGEVVAVDAKGHPAGFQSLQGRIHLTQGEPQPGRVAFIAFDLIRDGDADLRERPLVERRARLEKIFQNPGTPMLRLSEQVRGDGRALYEQALDRGWEGLIAKYADSRYRSGKRTPDWRKLKIVHEQEFVIGGWTEPRHTRAYFGALLLGVYEADALVYVGHVGTGFNEKELARLMKLLRSLETKTCPFRERPPSNEKPAWVEPRLVAQVKFTEWTADGRLRHPVYLGLRDDKRATDVTREQKNRFHGATKERLRQPAAQKAPSARRAKRQVEPRDQDEPVGGDIRQVVEQLQALEGARRDGTIELPGGGRLAVTNLTKIFWPQLKITKGELLRYYAEVSPFILPAVAGRPLVMKRLPNGIAGQTFYQHRAQPPPPGVRVEMVEAAERRPQLVGGDLLTLLYMTQLASISQDPWFSRVQTPLFADHVALDLDPMPDVPFSTVLEVACWIRDELQALGAEGFPKTSCSDGLHVYIPMPPQTPYEAGLLFAQIIATVVAGRHPKHATVERTVKRRGRRVYVDYLQNILGKTLATAYSARASDFAGVSTPLRWAEVESGVRREDFTLRSAPARFKSVGDLWQGLRRSKGVDLTRVERYARRIRTGSV